MNKWTKVFCCSLIAACLLSCTGLCLTGGKLVCGDPGKQIECELTTVDTPKWCSAIIQCPGDPDKPMDCNDHFTATCTEVDRETSAPIKPLCPKTDGGAPDMRP